MRKDIINSVEKIKSWINENQSKAFICKQLDCRPSTLDKYLIILGLPYEGNKSGKGIKICHFRKNALDYSKTKNVKSNKLKNKLLDEGIKERKCERCKNVEWNNEPIPLQLHHIDGNNFNNKFNNLQILCPSCHTQTPNYGSKNKRGSGVTR